jgi:uncharacterized caspase-like protein
MISIEHLLGQRLSLFACSMLLLLNLSACTGTADRLVSIPAEMVPATNQGSITAAAPETDIVSPARPSSSTKSLSAIAGGQRIALIIGNERYESSPLLNPVNDARAMSEALQDVGFQVVLLENATIKQMSDAARNFGDKLQKGDVGLFFYAGHGIQIKGRNYLIPIDADIQREDEVSFNSFDAGRLLEKMEVARSSVNIVILDACRNNPFARSFRSSSQGLAQMDAPVGSYLSFATAPAKVASDGINGNGLYTQHLLKAIRTPGLKIEEVFKQVRINVMADSAGQQIPWDNSSLTGDFYFIPPGPVDTSITPAAIASPSTLVGKSANSAVDQASEPTSMVKRISPSSPTSPVSQTISPASPTNPTNSPTSSTKPTVSPTSPAEPTTVKKVLTTRVSPSLRLVSPPPTSSTVKVVSETELTDLYQKGLSARNTGDLAAAAEAFRQASDGGHAEAKYELGLLLKIGRKPIVQDLPQAQQLFLEAAGEGSLPAQYEVAQMFAQGIGIDADCTQARSWARKAAEAGSPEAAELLGQLNMADCGGSRNPHEAARWLRIAADKGLVNAKFSLGVLYMTGDGVAKDLTAARKWLTAAESDGNRSAQFYLRRLDN